MIEGAKTQKKVSKWSTIIQQEVRWFPTYAAKALDAVLAGLFCCWLLPSLGVVKQAFPFELTDKTRAAEEKGVLGEEGDVPDMFLFFLFGDEEIDPFRFEDEEEEWTDTAEAEDPDIADSVVPDLLVRVGVLTAYGWEGCVIVTTAGAEVVVGDVACPYAFVPMFHNGICWACWYGSEELEDDKDDESM